MGSGILQNLFEQLRKPSHASHLCLFLLDQSAVKSSIGVKVAIDGLTKLKLLYSGQNFVFSACLDTLVCSEERMTVHGVFQPRIGRASHEQI